ncbi:MAG: hypothetical protein H0W64_06905 [Gammaproteobacteria bacterium]|nr:hypothetical protein [Gammaproteobacteria bacterium]
MLNRKINVTDENNEILWQKKGDFADVSYKNQQVVYDTTNPDSKIKQLKVVGHRDGDIIIAFKTKKPQFDTITNELVNKGYLAPDFNDKSLGIYRINVPNINFLTSFLQTLGAIEPSINTIAPEIIVSVKPYSKEEPTIPGWNKSGSFANTYSYGAELNRCETYTSTLPDAKIKKLKLLGYYSGDICIFLNLQKSQYDAVIDPLVANGFTKPDFIYKDCGFHKIDIPNEAALNQFLNIISAVEPSINTITNNIKQSYTAVKTNSDNRSVFDLLQSNDDMDIDGIGLGFGGLGGFDSAYGFGAGLERLILEIQLAELQLLTEAVPSKFSNNTSSFFGNSAKKCRDIDNEKLISDEQIAASAFGQASNTARRMGH